MEQTEVFEAAEQFARVEGILPAPESSHAIRVAIDEALKCKETGEEKTIVFGLTGTGYFDMTAYEKFNDGEMNDYIPTDADLAAGLCRPAPGGLSAPAAQDPTRPGPMVVRGAVFMGRNPPARLPGDEDRGSRKEHRAPMVSLRVYQREPARGTGLSRASLARPSRVWAWPWSNRAAQAAG